MTITRRGFLKSILALGAAPAIVKAESLMKIWTPPQDIYVPAPESFQLWNAQIERSFFGDNFVGSVWIRQQSGAWERQTVEVKPTEPGVMPILRVDRKGLGVQSGGTLVARMQSPIADGMAPAQTARIEFHKDRPDGHLTLGDPQGIGFYGAGVTLAYATTEPTSYPLLHNFDPAPLSTSAPSQPQSAFQTGSQTQPTPARRRLLRTPGDWS